MFSHRRSAGSWERPAVTQVSVSSSGVEYPLPVGFAETTVHKSMVSIYRRGVSILSEHHCVVIMWIMSYLHARWAEVNSCDLKLKSKNQFFLQFYFMVIGKESNLTQMKEYSFIKYSINFYPIFIGVLMRNLKRSSQILQKDLIWAPFCLPSFTGVT